MVCDPYTYSAVKKTEGQTGPKNKAPPPTHTPQLGGGGGGCTILACPKRISALARHEHSKAGMQGPS